MRGIPSAAAVSAASLRYISVLIAHAHRLSFSLRPPIHSRAQGFDEYMNLVLDEAEEVDTKTKKRTPIGRILLKGDNITALHPVGATVKPSATAGAASSSSAMEVEAGPVGAGAGGTA
jgi:hypothetical protein